jgi:hypothetical protein
VTVHSHEPIGEDRSRCPAAGCELRLGIRRARSANLCMHADVFHSTVLRATAPAAPLSSSPLLPTVGCERGDGL